jgi:hypothetical protein
VERNVFSESFEENKEIGKVIEVGGDEFEEALCFEEFEKCALLEMKLQSALRMSERIFELRYRVEVIKCS